jgi:hypothetical protein
MVGTGDMVVVYLGVSIMYNAPSWSPSSIGGYVGHEDFSNGGGGHLACGL